MLKSQQIAVTFSLLIAAALLAIAAFMLYDVKGDWSFVLPFRSGKLLALILVAYSVAVSTVLLQTVTHNHILTPSLMGFDRLYILIQAVFVFSADRLHFGFHQPIMRFIVSAVLLTVFTLILFQWLFSKKEKDLQLVLLAGVICGIFFNTATNFIGRITDPNAFAVLQDSAFANFNSYNGSVLGIAALLIILISLIALPLCRVFDVLALGKHTAIALGIDYRCVSAKILTLTALLVAVSTALTGPVTFFGLLVANLAYRIAATARHIVILPMAVLIAIITLVGGQCILERVFHFNTALSIIIDFIGGITFIFLLLKGKIR